MPPARNPRPNLRWPRLMPRWLSILGMMVILAGALWICYALIFSWRGVTSPWAALGGVLIAGGGTLTLTPWHNRLERQGRRRIRHDALVTLVPWFVAVVILALVAPKPLLTQATTFVIFPFLAFGSSLLGMRRVGQSRFCGGCEYPFIDDSRAAVCPECGHDWHGPLGVVIGERRTSKHRALGLAIVGLGMLLPVVLLFGQSVYQRTLPVTVLQWLARHQGFEKETTWTELSRRTLSPAQERSLAITILDQRLRRDPFQSRTGNAWLNALYSAKRLPPDLEQRFLAEQIRPYLIGPMTARVGEQFNVVLLGRQGQIVGSPLESRIALRGFDHAHPDTRSTTLLAYVLDDTALAMTDNVRSVIKASGTFPHTAVRATAPGPLVVRCTVYVALYPAPGPFGDFAWSPDGEPVLAPTPVWSKRYDLEHTVQVQP